MQFSVYDVMTKIKQMETIFQVIESDDKTLDDCSDVIYELLQEYSEILNNAKVRI